VLCGFFHGALASLGPVGRRTRKRKVPARVGPEPPPRPARRPRPAKPPAPWGSFPVTEIAISAGMIALIVGFLRGPNGTVPMLVGFAVCALAVFELVSREHFAGVRSHALLLSLGPVVVLEAILYAVGVHGPILLAVALGVYGSLFFALRAQYRRARDRRALMR
jgi:hypothetical protein